jgi:hypothetical protein
MSNTGSIELTEGCNSACPDCGVGALPGVRDYIPFSFLEFLFSRFSDEFSRRGMMLYFASEPFDYKDGDKDYIDVHRLFERRVGFSPDLITSVPRGMEKKILSFALYKNSLDDSERRFISALSITRLNYDRIERALLAMMPQLRLENQIKMPSKYALRVCYEFDEFKEDGRLIGLNMNSNKKRWILVNLDEILEKLGIQDKKLFFLNGINSTTILKAETIQMRYDEKSSFFSFLQKYNRSPTEEESEEIFRRQDEIRKQLELKQKKHCSIPEKSFSGKGLGQLFIVSLPNGHYLASESRPANFELISKYLHFLKFTNLFSNVGVEVRDFRYKGEDSKNIHNIALGPKNKDALPNKGIGCFHGVLISPSGVYNVQTRKPTSFYPHGIKKTPIDPNNFKVANYYRIEYGVDNEMDVKKEAAKFSLSTI